MARAAVRSSPPREHEQRHQRHLAVQAREAGQGIDAGIARHEFDHEQHGTIFTDPIER
jgi:hypothetical protein